MPLARLDVMRFCAVRRCCVTRHRKKRKTVESTAAPPLTEPATCASQVVSGLHRGWLGSCCSTIPPTRHTRRQRLHQCARLAPNTAGGAASLFIQAQK